MKYKIQKGQFVSERLILGGDISDPFRFKEYL